MNIGVLSFPFGVNYGGVLQCYAMKHILEERGHNVTFICYTSHAMSRMRQIISTFRASESIADVIPRLAGRLRYMLRNRHPYDWKQKYEAFDKFRATHLKFTPHLNSATIGEYANRHFDAIIVGSDQVWTDLTSDDPVHFIGWTPEFRGRRISYAACSAHKGTSRYKRKLLRPLLDRFEQITVRDTTTAKLVESITGKVPEVVPDPTLLHSFEELREKDGLSASLGDYILVYVLGTEIAGGNTVAFQRIKQLTGKPDAKIVCIRTESTDDKLLSCSDVVLDAASPVEWLNLIADACAVYTDSFHASIFSMKFSVPFIAFYSDAIRASRLVHLRNKYNLAGVVDKASSIRALSHYHLPTLSSERYISL